MNQRELHMKAVSDLFQQFLLDPDKLASVFQSKLVNEFPEYSKISPELAMPALADAIIRINSAVSTGREFDESDYNSFESYGAARARLRIPLDIMLRGWQIAVRTTVDRIVESGRAKKIDEKMLVDITRSLFNATELAMESFSAGYKAARISMNDDIALSLAPFLKRALVTSPDSDTVRPEAIEHGFRLDREYHTVFVIPPTGKNVREVERNLQNIPGLTAPDGAITVTEERIVGLCTRNVVEYPEVTVGVGPLAPIGSLGNSMRSATRAATTAHMFNMTGCYSLSDLGLLPAVAADREVGDLMYEKFVLPLGVGEAAEVILETLDEYLDTRQNVEATATKLHVHQNTIRYRIARYEKIIDCTLKDPNVSREIWWALRRRELSSDAQSQI